MTGDGDDDGERGVVLGTRQVYEGRVVDLRLERVRLPGGAEAELEVVRHAGAAAVLPLTDDGRVVLVRQYRHAAGGWILEAPAGTLEPGESPERCAHREVVEETGHRAATLEPLGWVFTTPGFCDERIWLFLARGLEPCEQALEADEVLRVEHHPLPTAVAMATTGDLTDAKTVTLLLRAARRLGI